MSVMFSYRYLCTRLRENMHQNITGNNAYALISAPRHSGTEAMVVSASWFSRLGEEDGTINIRGVATVLALANFLKSMSPQLKSHCVFNRNE